MSELSGPLFTSLFVAAVAVAASLPVAVPLALLLARREFPGKTLVETIVTIPLVLPPVVTGYLLLLLLARGRAPGRWIHDVLGIDILFTPAAAALAAAVVSFPLLVRTLRVAIEAVDPGLEQAARSLGAGRWTALRTVTLPLARGGVAAAVVLSFARALGEFGATLVVAGTMPGGRSTMPVSVWTSLQSGNPSRAVPLVVASVALAFVAIALGERLARRAAR